MSRIIGIVLLSGLLGASAGQPAVTLAAAAPGGSRNAFALAGLVLDHGHRIQPGDLAVNVRVVTEVIPEEHAGKAYDAILLILPSTLKEGHIVALTSGSTASCRDSLKSLLTDRLNPAVVAEAYKGAKLTRVEDNQAVRQLATQWRTRNWIRNCAEQAEGDHDVLEVLILNDVGG